MLPNGARSTLPEMKTWQDLTKVHILPVSVRPSSDAECIWLWARRNKIVHTDSGRLQRTNIKAHTYLHRIRILYDHIWLTALSYISLLQDLLQLKHTHTDKPCLFWPKKKEQDPLLSSGSIIAHTFNSTQPQKTPSFWAVVPPGGCTLMTRKMSGEGSVMEKMAERARVEIAVWGVWGRSMFFIWSEFRSKWKFSEI